MIKKLIYFAFIVPFLRWKRHIAQMYRDEKICELIRNNPEVWRKCNE